MTIGDPQPIQLAPYYHHYLRAILDSGEPPRSFTYSNVGQEAREKKRFENISKAAHSLKMAAMSFNLACDEFRQAAEFHKEALTFIEAAI